MEILPMSEAFIHNLCDILREANKAKSLSEAAVKMTSNKTERAKLFTAIELLGTICQHIEDIAFDRAQAAGQKSEPSNLPPSPEE